MYYIEVYLTEKQKKNMKKKWGSMKNARGKHVIIINDDRVIWTYETRDEARKFKFAGNHIVRVKEADSKSGTFIE